MRTFYCRSAEEEQEDAIAIQASDEEEAALTFAAQWDMSCGNCSILNDEYQNGFPVIITDTLKDQAPKYRDRWQRFLITGELVPHYSATPD